jgi:DNA-binding MarR family transcriptional regulator
MPPRRDPGPARNAAATLARVAPLAGRWIERLLAAHEPPLTVAQFLALEAIAGGDVAGVDLARSASVTPAAVSQLVAALESTGYVERARSAEGRRRQPLVLTRVGRSVLDSARLLTTTRLAELFDEVPPPELDAIDRSLRYLDAVLTGAAPPRVRPPARPHPPHPRR